MRRARTVYRSNRLANFAKEDVYSMFPEIDDPLCRAYYLPIVDAIYFPPVFWEDPRFQPIAVPAHWHETTHSVVADTVATCEQRYFSYHLLGGVANFVERNVRRRREVLMIPSLDIYGSGNKKYNGLRKIADYLDMLFSATSLIQEIVAGAILVESIDWDPNRARAFIRSSVAELGEETSYLLDEETLDEFIFTFEMIGGINSIFLAQYALNKTGLSKAGAIKRLRHAVRVARHFNERFPIRLINGRPMEAGPRADEQVLDYSTRFWRYLSVELSEGGHWYSCPLAGSCFSTHFIGRTPGPPAMEDLLQANHLFSSAGIRWIGGHAMNYQRCGNRPKGASPQLSMSLIEGREPGKHAVSFAGGEYWEKTSKDLTKPFLLVLIYLEAIRQQLWTGHGPRCCCHPFADNLRHPCPFRGPIAWIWQLTEPDPDVSSETSWKEETPDCFE